MAALYNQVYGIIGGIPVKFPGYPESQKNACNHGMFCPGKKGDSQAEVVQLPVAPEDPLVSYSFFLALKESYTFLQIQLFKTL